MLNKAISISVAQPDNAQCPARLASFRAPPTLLHALSDARALSHDGNADTAGFVDVTYRCAVTTRTPLPCAAHLQNYAPALMSLACKKMCV